ncbi:MAG TPA: leucyl aminopeptidase [Blastocatellia bacterium]|nr:leucyl aminopeptidase [Blastocatellia bacterium]
MKIDGNRKGLSEIDEDVLIVPVFEGENPRDGALGALDHLTRGAVSELFETEELEGKRDQWVLLRTTGDLQARRLLLYGAGKHGEVGPLRLQRLAGAAVRKITTRHLKSAAFLVRDGIDNDPNVRAIVEGAALGQVRGDFYKSDNKERAEIERLTLVGESPEGRDFAEALAVGAEMAEAANFARKLAYEPGNVMTPTELARHAEEMAGREGLSSEVMGEEEMKQLGMGALLGVSRGSAEPARLVTLRYDGRGEAAAESGEAVSNELVAFIGKGITFDSGGISIKPAENMDEMKYDMGGAAAVIGAMQVIARLKPKANVLGIIAASENLPSGRAYKPGDVLRSLSGKTIEVINTDAEGRLVLADAMTHAIGLGATHIVDVATLTGACVIALGEVRAGIMGSDQQLIDDLIRAGEECGERLWQLPIDREYGEMIRSDIADMKNIGNRLAGAITAAMFLKNFTGSLPWAHLDIAGTAWLEREKPYMARGATGFGVRTMANFILDRAK